MKPQYNKLVVVALLLAIIALILPEAIEPDVAFEIVKNNTDLCRFNHTSLLCDGSRQSNVTYYTNNTPIVLYVFAHANLASQTAGVFVYRDNVLIEAQAGRPLAAPEQTWRGITAIIPKNSSYRVNFTDYHHFEWYEDQILSGRNGTLSINQTGGCTGNCSFNVLTINALGKNNTSDSYLNSIRLFSPLRLIINDLDEKFEFAALNSVWETSRLSDGNISDITMTPEEIHLGSSNVNSSELNIKHVGIQYILDGRIYEYSQSGFDMGGANITNCSNCANTTDLSGKVNKTGDNMSGKLCLYNDAMTCDFVSSLNEPFLINTSINNGAVSKIATQMEISGSSHAPTSFAYGMHLTTKVSPANVSVFAPAWGVGFYSSAQCDTAFGDFGNCAAGYLARLTKNGTGNITTAYGLYVENQTAGITNYGIYSAGTNPSYMAGNLTLNKLSGAGNAYVCVDASGTLFRGNPGC